MGVVKRYIHQSLEYSTPKISPDTDRFIILRNLCQANNTGVIGQISALFEYTHEIFSELVEEASATAERIQSIGDRVQTLYDNLPNVEAETPQKQQLSNLGVSYSNKVAEDACQFLPEQRVSSIIHQHEECMPPPNLSLLDPYAESWVEEQNRMYQEAKKKRAARRKRVRATKTNTTKIAVKTVELRRNKYSAMGQEFSPQTSANHPAPQQNVSTARPVKQNVATPSVQTTKAAPVTPRAPVAVQQPDPEPIPIEPLETSPRPVETKSKGKSKKSKEKTRSEKKSKKSSRSSKKDKKSSKVAHPPPSDVAPPPPVEKVAPTPVSPKAHVAPEIMADIPPPPGNMPPPPPPPGNMPPPPPANVAKTPTVGGGLNLAAASLKSVPEGEQGEKKPVEKRSALLNAIQAGTQLKKVDTEAIKEANKKEDSGGFNVAKILARRAAMEFSDEEDDNSFGDDDWDD